jgi:hypothetical protein
MTAKQEAKREAPQGGFPSPEETDRDRQFREEREAREKQQLEANPPQPKPENGDMVSINEPPGSEVPPFERTDPAAEKQPPTQAAGQGPKPKPDDDDEDEDEKERRKAATKRHR